MATRNFIQRAQAYGSDTCTITAVLDGIEVYAGPVSTINTPLPPMPGTEITNVGFTWMMPADFQGSKTLLMTVTGSDLILGDTEADRSIMSDTSEFNGIWYTQIIDGIEVTDCLSNVAIDGVAQVRSTDLPGQWNWLIRSGQSFQATLNVVTGVTYPDWDPALTYNAISQVVYGNLCYTSDQAGAGAGLIPPDNPQVWSVIPFPIWNISESYAVYQKVRCIEQNGNYTALQSVPAGTDILNTAYWQRFSDI
jgi:hypothetical protein